MNQRNSENIDEPQERLSNANVRYDEYNPAINQSVNPPLIQGSAFNRTDSFFATYNPGLAENSPIFQTIGQPNESFDDDEYDESQSHNPAINPSDYQPFSTLVSPPPFSSLAVAGKRPKTNEQPINHRLGRSQAATQTNVERRNASSNQSSKRSNDDKSEDEQDLMRDAGSMGLFGEEDDRSVNQSSDGSLPRSSGNSVNRSSDHSINPFTETSINQLVTPNLRLQTVTPLSSINISLSPINESALLSPVHQSFSSSSDQSDQSGSHSVSDSDVSDDENSGGQSNNHSNEQSDDPAELRSAEQSDDQSIDQSYSESYSQSDDQSIDQANDHPDEPPADQQNSGQSNEPSINRISTSNGPANDPSSDPSTDETDYGFAVPEVPLTGRKRARLLDDFNQSFSVPNNYQTTNQSASETNNQSSSSLQIPSNIALANVSPVSQEFAGLRYQSTLPPPSVPINSTSPFHPNTQSTSQATNQSSPSYSSPPQASQLTNQPIQPNSPSVGQPTFFVPPSSPRQDLIPSITARIDAWHRSGRVAVLINNANQATDEYLTDQSNTETSSLTSDQASNQTNTPRIPHRLSLTNQSMNQQVNHSVDGLVKVDRYLRRRYVFSLLDADLIVKGVVYSKTSDGLLITISEVCWPDPQLTRAMSQPVLSSVSGEHEADWDQLEELGIRGECHLSEIQAAIINEIRVQHQTKSTSSQPTTGGKSVPSAGESSNASILDSFTIGDHVKALVISVDTFAEKVYLSMNNARVRYHQTAGPVKIQKLGPYRPDLPQHSPGLRPVDQSSPLKLSPQLDSLNNQSNQFNMPSFSLQHSEASTTAPSSSPHTTFTSLQRLPEHLQSTSSSSPATAPIALPSRARARPKKFLPWLRRQPLFLNPGGLSIMLAAYGINEHGTLMPIPAVATSEQYEAVRAAQNVRWAMESCAKGILMAKDGKYENALRIYNHALLIEPTLVAAMVARGAVYVLMNRLRDARQQFEKALELEPKHQQAQAYLAQAIKQLEQQRQEAVQASNNPPAVKRPRTSNQSNNQSTNQSKSIIISSDSDSDSANEEPSQSQLMTDSPEVDSTDDD